jgi:DNA polymerase/3'-5' exonuclease PolX
MKAGVLIKLLELERNSRINQSERSKFVYIAYTNIIVKIRENFENIENIDVEKIINLPITTYMKNKIKKMLVDKKINSKKSKKSVDKKSKKSVDKKSKKSVDKKSKKSVDKKSKKSVDKNLKFQLEKYMGLGSKKSEKLIADGLKSLEQLHKDPWFSTLPLETRVTLKNKPIRRIPRKHIQILEPMLINTSLCKVVLVGSYRRQAKFSRDIDIMLVSEKKEKDGGKETSDLLGKYLTFLKHKFSKIFVYSMGANKMSLVCGFKFNSKMIFYKIDVFVTTKKNEPAMLLYSTGSKLFNIRMRTTAKRKGYLLNQTGLHDRKTGKLFPIKKEAGFFIKLNMPYQSPQNRS